MAISPAQLTNPMQSAVRTAFSDTCWCCGGSGNCRSDSHTDGKPLVAEARGSSTGKYEAKNVAVAAASVAEVMVMIVHPLW